MSTMAGKPGGNLLQELIELLEVVLQEAQPSVEYSVGETRRILNAVLPKAGLDPAQLPESVLRLRAVLGQESDRGCALTAAAFLEAALQELLRRYFVADPSVAEGLFGGAGALATFSARIDLAYLLGLIGSAARRDLHLIHKIRNEFAHAPGQVSFSAPAIVARCGERYHDYLNEPLAPRKQLMRVVMGVLACVHARSSRVEHRSSPRDPGWDKPGDKARVEKLRQLIADAV